MAVAVAVADDTPSRVFGNIIEIFMILKNIFINGQTYAHGKIWRLWLPVRDMISYAVLWYIVRTTLGQLPRRLGPYSDRRSGLVTRAKVVKRMQGVVTDMMRGLSSSSRVHPLAYGSAQQGPVAPNQSGGVFGAEEDIA